MTFVKELLSIFPKEQINYLSVSGYGDFASVIE